MPEAVAARLPYAQPQRHDWSALGAFLAAQEASRVRVVVRFTRFTTQPLDPDNHAGSVKAALDCLRKAFPTLIADDNLEVIDLQLRQIRVREEAAQGTLIEIWPPA
jgi:hypothetical protein